MKKMIFSWALLLLLIGCAKDVDTPVNQADVTTGGQSVSFNASLNTRVESSSWTEGDEIGIFAYNETTEVVSNKCFRITDSATGALEPADGQGITLPSDGSTLRYYAYHPYDTERLSGTTFTLDISEHDKELTLLWASTEESLDTSISLHFAHQLAKVSFTTITPMGGGFREAPNVYLGTGVNSYGEFDILTGEFANVEAREDATLVGEKLSDSEYAFETYVLPTPDIDKTKVNLEYLPSDNLDVIDPYCYYWTDSYTTKWEAGREYFYEGVDLYLDGSSIPIIVTVYANGVEFNGESKEILVGEQFTVSYSTSPVEELNCNYSTTDSSVASNSKGVITGVSVGTATIKVTLSDGSYTTTTTDSYITVYVVENYGDSEKFDMITSYSSMIVGNTEQISTEGSYSGDVTYSSDWDAVASIDSSGQVTGVSNGMANITIFQDGEAREEVRLFVGSKYRTNVVTTLSDFTSGDNAQLPADSRLIITNSTLSSSNYTSLRSAILSQTEATDIHLVLLNVTTIEKEALYFASSDPCTTITEITYFSAPEISNNQIDNITNLKRVEWPKASVVLSNQFNSNAGNYSCPNVTNIEVGTYPGVVTTQLSGYAVKPHDTTLTTTTLKIGATSSDVVVNTTTAPYSIMYSDWVNSYTEFLEIIQVDNAL